MARRRRSRPRLAEPQAKQGGQALPCLTINRRSQALGPRGAQVAQLVEHATENRSVGGSIPPLGTTLRLRTTRGAARQTYEDDSRSSELSWS